MSEARRDPAVVPRPGRSPKEREREMYRLRTVEGLTLREIAERFGIGFERVRQILNRDFALRGATPASEARRREKIEAHRAESRARAQAQAAALLAAWRSGASMRELAARFAVTGCNAERVIREQATDADRAGRADALRRSREGRRAT